MVGLALVLMVTGWLVPYEQYQGRIRWFPCSWVGALQNRPFVPVGTIWVPLPKAVEGMGSLRSPAATTPSISGF